MVVNLHEEYNKRHGLRAPVIKRVEGKSYLLYHADKKVFGRNWAVLQLSSKKDAYAPASYTITWQTPRFNGLVAHGMFLEGLFDPKSVQWDEYEVEMLDVARRNDLKAISDLSEAKLAIWEMYLFGIDDKISVLGPNIRLKILRSLDCDLTTEERSIAQEDAMQSIALQSRDLFARWESLRAYYDPKTYATWLADLTNNMRDQNFRQDFCDLQSVA